VAAVLFAATLPKLVAGGWVPAVIGLIVFMLMHTWWSGQGRVATRLREEELTVDELMRTIGDGDLHRLDGCAVFLTHDPSVAPLAVRALLDTAHVVPEHVMLLSWDVDDTPSAQPDRARVQVRSLGAECWDVTGVAVVLGYAERLDVGHILRDAVEAEPELLSAFEPGRVVFVVSELHLAASRSASWASWRQRVFLAMNRLARHQTDQLSLPRARTVVIGRELGL
jgi:KUP system potassium uptake protein